MWLAAQQVKCSWTLQSEQIAGVRGRGCPLEAEPLSSLEKRSRAPPVGQRLLCISSVCSNLRLECAVHTGLCPVAYSLMQPR